MSCLLTSSSQMGSVTSAEIWCTGHSTHGLIWCLPLHQDIMHCGRVSSTYALSRSHSNGARLAVSAKGFLGTVPPGANVGDEIMVHIECPMPVVVRQGPEPGFALRITHINQYLVGKAHLGMMRAEWVGSRDVDEAMKLFASLAQNVVLL
jgi:hypothetical protein